MASSVCEELYKKLSKKGYDPPAGELGEILNCLRGDIKELTKDLEDLQSQGTSVSSSLNLGFGNVASQINKMTAGIAEFYVSVKQQYTLGQQLAEVYKETSINLGLSIGRSKDFSTVFKQGVAQIAEFGGKMTDVQELYKNFSKDSGRNRFVSPEDIKNMFLLEKSTGLYGSEVAQVYERFDLMGKSLSDVNEEMQSLIIESQKIGLNSSKVVNVLSSNLNKMDKYSFANGVRGMTEMAKQAVKMRVDVSSVLQMAEKFYQPEAAIEAAAELQLLGGDIAAAFGDPFTVMYEARNKPEELAKRVQKMTENMIQFNEESGEYELPAEAKMQFDALSKSIGISSSELIDMSRQTAKLRDVKMQLSGNAFSEEELEGIANMAKVKDGEFKVDIFDPKTGEKMEKSIEELSSGDVEMLLKPPPTEEEYMQQMVTNSMTTIKLLQGLSDKAKFSFMSEIGDVYQLQEEAFGSVIESVRDFDEALLKVTKESGFGNNLKLLAGATDEQVKILTDSIGKSSEILIQNSKKFFDIDFEKMYKDTGEKFLEKVNEITEVGLENMADILKNKYPQDVRVKDPNKTYVDDAEPNNNNNNNGSSAFNYNPNQNTNTINGKLDVNLNVNGLNNIPDDQYGNIGMIMKQVIIDTFPAMFNRINSNGGSPDGGSQSQNGKGYEQNLGSFDINFVG